MKTSTLKLIIASAAVCLSTAAFAGTETSNANQVKANTPAVQKVVVQAKRMSAEEKSAYDMALAQSQVMQVIEIRAKRLTPAQKNQIAAE